MNHDSGPEPILQPHRAAAQMWQTAARQRIVELLGDHFKWQAIVDRLAAFFFRADQPPLRLSDSHRLAAELTAQYQQDGKPLRCTPADIRVVLNSLEGLADCYFMQADPKRGGAVEVPISTVQALLSRLRQEGTEGQEAREAINQITIDWKALKV